MSIECSICAAYAGTLTPPCGHFRALPAGAQLVIANGARSRELPIVGTAHPEKTGPDKMRDGRMVLAKGAGPGIWNRWVSHARGHRVFWSFVNGDYLV